MNRGLVDFLYQQVISGRTNLFVTEMACGSGFSAHLISQYPEVKLSVAADLNLEDYKQASLPQFGASFAMMDIYKPAVRLFSMDLVWNSSSIEELDDPPKAIRSMASVLKPDGWIFVGVPNRHHIAGLLNLLPNKATKTWLGRNYSVQELRTLVSSEGFTIKKIHSYLFGIFIGALAVKAH
jgi:SAM-dependent methyltransferase